MRALNCCERDGTNPHECDHEASNTIVGTFVQLGSNESSYVGGTGTAEAVWALQVPRGAVAPKAQLRDTWNRTFPPTR
jgi:hypothetical protein